MWEVIPTAGASGGMAQNRAFPVFSGSPGSRSPGTWKTWRSAPVLARDGGCAAWVRRPIGEFRANQTLACVIDSPGFAIKVWFDAKV